MVGKPEAIHLSEKSPMVRSAVRNSYRQVGIATGKRPEPIGSAMRISGCRSVGSVRIACIPLGAVDWGSGEVGKHCATTKDLCRIAVSAL
jgi:hypothetical protein